MSSPLKLLADENIPFLDRIFAPHVEVVTAPGRDIRQSALTDTDILLVRSVTPVNADLLNDTSVKYVGTTTIGTDHIDAAYLKSRDIGFGYAPGCNANAVVDYVLAVLAHLACKHSLDWRSRKIGIVGCGNIGGELFRRLTSLGVECLRCDPILAESGVQGLISLAKLLREADIISLHVPLSYRGHHPTHHMISMPQLQRLKHSAVLVNSSRGAVVDNAALCEVLVERPDMMAVLDVWENEPDINNTLLERTTLATPHIAGYSIDGKLGGVIQVYRSCAAFFGWGLATPDRAEILSPRTVSIKDSSQTTECVNSENRATLEEVVREIYPIDRDDHWLRDALRSGNKSFDQLRKEYPNRREFCQTDVRLTKPLTSLETELIAMGFLHAGAL